MPLEFQEVEIPLARGLDQKTERLFRSPGVLRHARNVDHRTGGVLRKRRGYERVELAGAEVSDLEVEESFLGVATFRGELVLIGSEYVYGVPSYESLIGNGGNAIARRGPTLRGGYTIEHVHSSSLGDEL